MEVKEATKILRARARTEVDCDSAIALNAGAEALELLAHMERHPYSVRRIRSTDKAQDNKWLYWINDRWSVEALPYLDALRAARAASEKGSQHG